MNHIGLLLVCFAMKRKYDLFSCISTSYYGFWPRVDILSYRGESGPQHGLFLRERADVCRLLCL